MQEGRLIEQHTIYSCRSTSGMSLTFGLGFGHSKNSASLRTSRRFKVDAHSTIETLCQPQARHDDPFRTRKVAEVASRNRAAVTRHHTQGQCQASKHAVQLVLHASTKAAKNSSLSRGQLRNIITLYISSPAIAIGRPPVCTATCLEAVSILHSANAFQINMACDKEAIHRHTPHNITYISLPPRLRNHARASEEDEERR